MLESSLPLPPGEAQRIPVRECSAYGFPRDVPPGLPRASLCSGGRMPGGSSPAMSFQDFAHGLHRYGIMSYIRDAQAGEAKGDESSSDPPDPVRAVFRDAKRGNWPGDVTVRVNRFAL